MSGYLAYIINSLNSDAPIGDTISSTKKINEFLANLGNDGYEYFGSVVD